MLYGATLSASEELFHVFAPKSHSIPTIEVLSASAEFELISTNKGLAGVARSYQKSLWDPPGLSGEPELTFSVVSVNQTISEPLLTHCLSWVTIFIGTSKLCKRQS
jgi:hypothetical protein